MKSLSAVLLIAAAAFAQTPPAPQKKATAPATAPAQKKATAPAPAAPAGPPREPGLYAIINTSMGTIVAKLFEKETPVTIQNFTALARGTKPWKDPKTGTMVAKPLYNGVTFHRVIKGFMIQTGDPTATGSHDCGFTIKDEILPSLKYDQPGRLGMANIGSPNTGGCQFFITDQPYPGIDASARGAYTIFGQVVEGIDVVHQIDNVPTDPANDKPRTPVRIVTLTIKREGPPPAAPAATKKSTAPAAPKKSPTSSAPPSTPVKKQ